MGVWGLEESEGTWDWLWGRDGRGHGTKMTLIFFNWGGG